MPNIIRSAHYRCTEGTSDKVYSVALTERNGEYFVLTAYGPTGGRITKGPRNDQPLTLQNAEKEYQSVVKSRLKKKYVENPQANNTVFDLAA
jgi:hypothetical protein